MVTLKFLEKHFGFLQDKLLFHVQISIDSLYFKSLKVLY